MRNNVELFLFLFTHSSLHPSLSPKIPILASVSTSTRTRISAQLLSSVLPRPAVSVWTVEEDGGRINALLLLYPMNLNWNGMKTHWHFDYAIKMLEAPLSVPEGFSRCQPGPVSLCRLRSHSSGSGTRACARTPVLASVENGRTGIGGWGGCFAVTPGDLPPSFCYFLRM